MVAPEEGVRRSKYVSHRRNSLAAAFGDDDNMREEIDKLNGAQVELQRELSSVMKKVEVMHGSYNLDDSSGIINNKNSDSLQGSFSGSFQFPEVVEESPRQRRRPKTFASGFFQLLTTQQQQETLEAQKQRQLELFKENLKRIDPDLRDVVDCQNEMQHVFVEKQKHLEELKAMKQRKLQQLHQKRTTTLQEEKQRQMEILKLNLQTIDPDLNDVVDCLQETQKELVARKRNEVEQVKAVVNDKLRELDQAQNQSSTRSNVWTSMRKSLEHMIVKAES